MRTLDWRYSFEKVERWKTCFCFHSVMRETFFIGGKRKYSTCTFVLKVFKWSNLNKVISVQEAETIFALRPWHWDRTPQCSATLRQGTDIFSAFNRATSDTGGKRSSPNSVVPVLREDWGEASLVGPRILVAQNNADLDQLIWAI